MASLTPCPSCSRHVKVGPPTCPFCGGDVPVPAARAVALQAGKPLTRAALMFAGAAAVTACGGSSSAYGVPVFPDASDAEASAPDAHDAGADGDADAGQPMGAYGGPILDSGAQ